MPPSCASTPTTSISAPPSRPNPHPRQFLTGLGRNTLPTSNTPPSNASTTSTTPTTASSQIQIDAPHGYNLEMREAVYRWVRPLARPAYGDDFANRPLKLKNTKTCSPFSMACPTARSPNTKTSSASALPHPEQHWKPIAQTRPTHLPKIDASWAKHCV